MSHRLSNGEVNPRRQLVVVNATELTDAYADELVVPRSKVMTTQSGEDGDDLEDGEQAMV